MAKIMVVDDEEKNRELLSDFLESKGYDVIAAFGGKDALAKMNEEPNLVLLDIMMPDMHGMNVLDEMKNMAPDVEIIMVTALSEHVVGLESLKRGAYEFISKPINLRHLESVVSFTLAQKGIA